jgi:hypothetical protein
VLLLAAPSPAFAHSGPPAVVDLAFDGERILAGTSFGLVLSEDGGLTWRWICPGAYEGRSTDDQWVAIGPSGALHAAGRYSVGSAGADGCDWTETTVFDEFEPGAHDMMLVPDGRVLFAHGPIGVDNAVRIADAAGGHPAVLGPLRKVVLDSMRVAPSDPMRLYVAQWGPTDGTPPRRAVINRSDDGGMTWTPHEVPLEGFERYMSILGVDPADPDRLIVRMQNPVGGERVLLSEEGGVTGSWRAVLTLEYVDAGVWGSAGAFVGGALDGLWHSPDGITWTQVRELLTPHCLVMHEGELWACGNDWSDGFAIGRSADGGRTFEPVLRLGRIREPLSCAAGTSVAETCPDEMFELELIWSIAPPVGEDAGVPMPDAGSPDAGDAGNLDAGMGTLDARIPRDSGRRPRRDSGRHDPEPFAARGGGCACATPGAPAGTRLPYAGLIVLMAAVAARRARGCRRCPDR